MEKIPPLLKIFINKQMGRAKKMELTKLQLRKKYVSCLMLCYTYRYFRLKEIAKKAKVSYPVLREWRTEEEFKREVSNLIKNYVDIFLAVISDTVLCYNVLPNWLILPELEVIYYSSELKCAIALELKQKLLMVNDKFKQELLSSLIIDYFLATEKARKDWEFMGELEKSLLIIKKGLDNSNLDLNKLNFEKFLLKREFAYYERKGGDVDATG